MAGKCVPANNLAAGGKLKPFGCAFVCFQLQFHFYFGQLQPPDDSVTAAVLGETRVLPTPSVARAGDAPSEFWADPPVDGAAGAPAARAVAAPLGVRADDVPPARARGDELFPPVFLGASTAVKFGPSCLGRDSTNPTSPTSVMSLCIMFQPSSR